MKRLTIATLALSAFSLLATFSLAGQRVEAQAMVQDCSTNSVVRCGASSAADLIAKIRANNPNDLQAIYSHFKLTPDKYDAFIREAKMGMAYRNGEIKVDGQVVAKDAWSLGREQKSYSQPYRIGEATYHRSDSTEVLKQDLPVIVWFNDRGLLEIAILAACGNPMGGDNVAAPSYRCNQLRQEKVANRENTYRFTTDASAANGATVSRVVYDFGDSSAEYTAKSLDESVTHTYSKTGSFTAKVVVYVKLPGGKEVAANGSGCTKRIEIAERPQARSANWECTSLRATSQTGTDDEFAYTFRANTTTSNARLVRADFDFGDGNVTNGVQVTGSSNNVSTNHTYAGAGTYTAVATVYFEAEDGAEADNEDTSVTCQVEVTVQAPVTPAVATPEPPAAPTPELPKTGMAGMAGLFTGASALGTLGYRWRIRHRQGKVDALVNNLLQK